MGPLVGALGLELVEGDNVGPEVGDGVSAQSPS